MAGDDDLSRWADGVLDEEARIAEHSTDAELRDRALIETAAYYLAMNRLVDGWLWVAGDDPNYADKMCRTLIEIEGLDPAWASEVVSKMRELDAAGGDR